MFAVVFCVLPTFQGKPAVPLSQNPEPPILSQLKLLKVFDEHSPAETDGDSEIESDAPSWELLPESERPEVDESKLLSRADQEVRCDHCLGMIPVNSAMVTWVGLDDGLRQFFHVDCAPDHAVMHNFGAPLMAGLADFEWQTQDQELQALSIQAIEQVSLLLESQESTKDLPDSQETLVLGAHNSPEVEDST